MVIKKITLRNFGPFLGEHHLDLNTLPGKPLILVGALNGGGKTSILEATRLTLYGSACGNGKLRSMRYKDYLRMCVNNSSPKGSITSTEITFVRNEEGVAKEVRVARSWSVVDGEADETISVFVDGELEEALSNETGWNSYMSACLPTNLAHLFLFDGEQILHGGAGGVSPILKDGVYSLLGIETIDKLTNDLELFERKQMAELVKESALKELRGLEKKCGDQSVAIIEKKSQLESARDQFKAIEHALSMRRLQFENKGGEEYRNRDKSNAELKRLKMELTLINERLIECCAGNLNLELLLRELQALRKRAAEEVETVEAMASIQILKKRDAELAREVLSKSEAGLRTEIEAWLDADVRKRLGKISRRQLIGLGQEMIDKADFIIETGVPEARRAADALLAEQSKTEEQIFALEEKIRQIPSEEYIIEMERELTEAESNLSVAELNLKEFTKQIAEEERKLIEAEAELRRFKLENIDAEAKGSEAERLQRQTAKSLETLAAFKKRLITENIVLIQSLIEESLQRLLRKLSLIKRLTIDPETFEIHLESPSGAQLLWQQMSAGEQQIVTTAIIWGLARASGHVFPMMVDTPLGRLDETHRGKLLEHYYPEASHQVILLSTDKEIGPKEVSSLQDHVTRTYLVRHNEQTKVSDLTEGYFN